MSNKTDNIPIVVTVRGKLVQTEAGRFEIVDERGEVLSDTLQKFEGLEVTMTICRNRLLY